MDWLSTGVMCVWYASTLVVIGAAGAVRVLSPAHPSDAHGWDSSALRLARLVMPLVLLALIARLWLQTWLSFGADQTLTLQFAAVIVRETPWGAGWLWQLAASLVAWAIIAFASPRRWLLLLLSGVALGGCVGFTGHAAGANAYARLLMVTHGVHVVAAGLWLGSLAIVLRVSRPGAAAADPGTRDRLAHAIDRFSPQAVISVSVLASSGAVAAWQHLNSVAALFTPYGFVLITKMVAFGAAALCGFYNWRVVRPTLASRPDGPLQLRSMASLELVLGAIALVLTSVLTGMPMPEHR